MGEQVHSYPGGRHTLSLLSWLGAALWAVAGAHGAIVTGTITGGDGKPLPGARVEIRRPRPRGNGALYAAEADQQGKYRIVDVPAGTYRVLAKAGGQRARSRTGMIRPHDSLVRVDIMLPDRVAITGRLLLASGAPLANAPVGFWFSYNGSSGGPRGATTEADGTYRYYSGGGPGTYAVTARTPGFAAVMVRRVVLRPHGGTAGIDFIFKDPAGDISGTVYAPDGATPVANAQVRAWARTPYSILRQPEVSWVPRWDSTYSTITLTTGADGGFTLEDLQDPQYLLAARAPGFQVTHLPDPVHLNGADKLTGVDIVLRPAAPLPVPDD